VVVAALRGLERHKALAGQIESFWLQQTHSKSWLDHADMNTVMLATSLEPDGFLDVEAVRRVDTAIRLALVGDVMLGRGVDMVNAEHCTCEIYENYCKSAWDYVELAERVAPLPKSTGPGRVWGSMLALIAEAETDALLLNLETAVTTNAEPWPRKGINYRMHPENVQSLAAAKAASGTVFAALANNHVLDWSEAGLFETLKTLDEFDIPHAGAGVNADEAWRASELPLAQAQGVAQESRVIVVAVAHASSGTPAAWAATSSKAGVAFLEDFDAKALARVKFAVQSASPGVEDVVVLSVHWGGNWGWDAGVGQQEFAKAVIDECRVDVVWGHSSHHVKGVQVYRDKLILYGAGDFINDYEGIDSRDGREAEFGAGIGGVYLVSFQGGKLSSLELLPSRIKHLAANKACRADAEWLADALAMQGRRFNTTARLDEETGRVVIEW